MKTAAIIPLGLMNQMGALTYQPYMMSLWQVAAKNPEYAKFFKNRPEGTFLILDNGAAEGENPTPEQLMEVYPLVNPDEVILPDVVGDRNATIEQSMRALKLFRKAKLPYQFAAVPQGADFGEWLACMQYFLRNAQIDTLGINKFVTRDFQEALGEDVNVRLECVQAIVDFCEKYKIKVPQIHLLGCWSDITELQEIESAFPGVVRGTDSAIAYVYARAGLEYLPGSLRPDNQEIDFIDGTCDLDLLIKNVQHYADTAK